MESVNPDSAEKKTERVSSSLFRNIHFISTASEVGNTYRQGSRTSGGGGKQRGLKGGGAGLRKGTLMFMKCVGREIQTSPHSAPTHSCFLRREYIASSKHALATSDAAAAAAAV